jgi:hypothetical protein
VKWCFREDSKGLSPQVSGFEPAIRYIFATESR